MMSEQSTAFVGPDEATTANWNRPVNRLGRISLVIIMVACYIPFLYLFLKYGQFPDFGAFLVGVISVTLAFGPAWIIEPLSYFPALGTAGSYIGILAGSIGQMRVPSALVAKKVAEVEDGSQEAEIVATAGIIGSVFLNIGILVITVIGGTVLIGLFPAVVMRALSAYVLPSIFGAVVAMFSGGPRIKIAIPVMIVSFIMVALVNVGIASLRASGINLPSWITLLLMPVCIVVAVVISRIEYKAGWLNN
jgi:hypothetical protein